MIKSLELSSSSVSKPASMWDKENGRFTLDSSGLTCNNSCELKIISNAFQEQNTKIEKIR